MYAYNIVKCQVVIFHLNIACVWQNSERFKSEKISDIDQDLSILIISSLEINPDNLDEFLQTITTKRCIFFSNGKSDVSDCSF